MIQLIQNNQAYNNDLRAMLMAFYPTVKIAESPEKDADITLRVTVCYDINITTIMLEPVSGTPDEESSLTDTIMADYRDKDTFRNKLKLAIYGLLKKHTGQSLPWGDMTGVRPTKIAMKKLGEGAALEDVVSYYMDTYATSREKAVLAAKVAQNETELISAIDFDNDYCLYVGIPFCPSRCLYCSFTSYPIALYEKRAEEYIDRLCAELTFIAHRYRHKRLVAIYVGGGTPTSISHILLDKLLAHIETEFGLRAEENELMEFTVEAGRPDSITKDKLRVMKEHGVTRISINPQTMNDGTLKTIGRAHSAKQAEEAFMLARAMGFDNINMDLIAGLPGEGIDSMRYTLDRIMNLNPESITVHSLAIKRAAGLRQQMDSYQDSINKDMDGMHRIAEEASAGLGMKPYYLYRQKNIGGNLENVGYARPGKECLYNILIMEELTDIIAAGAGASTKLVFHSPVSEDNPGGYRVERIENCKSVDDYIGRFDEMLARKQRFF